MKKQQALKRANGERIRIAQAMARLRAIVTAIDDTLSGGIIPPTQDVQAMTSAAVDLAVQILDGFRRLSAYTLMSKGDVTTSAKEQ